MCDQQRLRSACAYAQFDQRLCLSLEYSLSVKLLTEQHLEFLSLKVGCRGSSESTMVKMPHCWKTHATAHIVTCNDSIYTMDYPKLLYQTRRKNSLVHKGLNLLLVFVVSRTVRANIG